MDLVTKFDLQIKPVPFDLLYLLLDVSSDSVLLLLKCLHEYLFLSDLLTQPLLDLSLLIDEPLDDPLHPLDPEVLLHGTLLLQLQLLLSNLLQLLLQGSA